MAKVFILAGESSGDLLGGPLIQALRDQSSDPLELIGVGGPSMQAAGLKSLFPMEELSLMGLFEIITHLPRLLRRLSQVTEFIKTEKPDVVVTIDLPDFSFRLAKRLRGTGIPHVHYTAPTVWAWRPGRAEKISKLVDHLLCILPFEPPYFTAHGLSSTFVGHMVTELGIDQIPREQFRKEHKIAKDTPLLCLLPGSRRGEVTRLLPTFKKTIQHLALLHPHLQVVVPLAPAVEDLVQPELKDLGLPITYVHTQEERYAAMRASNVALAASGTVNLELACAGIPFVIGYRMNALTAWLGRLIVKIKYMTMTNILLDRLAVPEFFQNDCTVDNLFKAVNGFLTDHLAAQHLVNDATQAMSMLRAPTGTPSQQAAEVVLERMGCGIQKSRSISESRFTSPLVGEVRSEAEG